MALRASATICGLPRYCVITHAPACIGHSVHDYVHERLRRVKLAHALFRHNSSVTATLLLLGPP